MLVEKNIVCPIIQKVLFKTQNDQNWPYQFFCIKNSPSVMLPVLVFLVKKDFFWLIGHQSSPKKPIMQPAESNKDF